MKNYKKRYTTFVFLMKTLVDFMVKYTSNQNSTKAKKAVVNFLQ
jgi:hypothetical protein